MNEAEYNCLKWADMNNERFMDETCVKREGIDGT